MGRHRPLSARPITFIARLFGVIVDGLSDASDWAVKGREEGDGGGGRARIEGGQMGRFRYQRELRRTTPGDSVTPPGTSADLVKIYQKVDIDSGVVQNPRY